MSKSDPSAKANHAREKFLGLSLQSTRKSYYPQLQAQLSALRENERRLRLLTDNLPARISYVDADRRFQFVNREYERVLGLGRDAIVGRHMRDVLGEDHYGKIEKQVGEVLAGNHVRFEVMLPEKGQGTIWLEANYVPYVEEDGTVLGFYGLTHDLTERKRAENALRESEAKNRELVHHAPAGICEFDIETRGFTSVNEVMCKYTGYSEEEFLSLDPNILLTDENKSAFDRMIEEVLAGDRRPAPAEFSFQCKDGRIIRVLVHARFFFEGDLPKRAMAVVHDVTALREAEEAKKQLEATLQQTQKLESLGTLAGGIAHDFNNLLMGIQGNASLALMENDPGAKDHKHLKNIETYVQRGVGLTRQLLGLARGGKYEAKPTDLKDLIVNSAEMFGRTKKEIQIELAVEKGLWSVEVDRGQIDQVLLNLCINASHAMPKGGRLTIGAHNVHLAEDVAAAYGIQPGRYVRVAVTDTGTGIDPEVRKKIFDPFFTTKKVGQGSGLGLASAFGIVKNHHGAIDVDSEPGRGSTFFFYLPVSRKSAREESRRYELPVSGHGTVLLVDDESMVLEVGEKLLNKIGYTVLTASSGESALDIYAQNADRIDLVILDIIMPQMGGDEVFDRLKAINPHVAVLLASGYSIDGQAEEIMARGCRAFIQKPFTIVELSKRLREVLG
ncbi:PAS domain S-box protein [uncultured Desulfosarcina sp.]|uniref:PAS domain-containing hybrid sensor histidine kinase/response regulator n=1 Tax=uncultured Desulfosarcina sp. TaxID=218289 RepID=UPI0029C6A913|nr:PAS domain S-box protein [uncultured Desulfosarcina sp.]